MAKESTGHAPGSKPRQSPHYVHATGTFLTGDVKPNEIIAFVTFEKRTTRCNDTESIWWMKYHPNPDYFDQTAHSVTKEGYYIPRIKVGSEFKSLELQAPLQILQLTASERIGKVRSHFGSSYVGPQVFCIMSIA